MVKRIYFLVIFPCVLIMGFWGLHWYLTQADPLRGLQRYAVSEHTQYDRMISVAGISDVVCERQLKVYGIQLQDIKEQLDKNRLTRGAYVWQDMHGTVGGNQVWIGCCANSKRDQISITPEPQNGQPTSTYVVELDHSMTQAEVQKQGLRDYGGMVFRL